MCKEYSPVALEALHEKRLLQEDDLQARYGDRVVSLLEAASLMSLSLATIEKMRKLGRIQEAQPGKVFLWSLAKSMQDIGFSLEPLDRHCRVKASMPLGDGEAERGPPTHVALVATFPTVVSRKRDRRTGSLIVQPTELPESFTGVQAPELSPHTVLTTGKVAKLLRVAPRTVSKLFDSGQLPGWRISNDRRMFLKDVVAYMVEHGIPMELLGKMPSPYRIVLLGEKIEADLLQPYFPSYLKEESLIVQTNNPIGLGAALTRHRCLCLLISSETAAKHQHPPKEFIFDAMREGLLPEESLTVLLARDEVTTDSQLQHNFHLTLFKNNPPQENAHKIQQLIAEMFQGRRVPRRTEPRQQRKVD